MVLILAGELLKKSEQLLVMGLHPSEVIKGYELACIKAVEALESMLFESFSIHAAHILSTRTLHLFSFLAIDSLFSCICSQTCDRLKTIWLRRHTFGSCR